MSDEPEHDYPQWSIDTEGVAATVESQGVHWEDTGGGHVEAERWLGNVRLSVGQSSDQQTYASVTAYLTPEMARRLASAIRSGQSGTWATTSCTMWVNRGWLYNEGPVRDDSDHQATIALTEETEGVRLAAVYESGDGRGDIRVETALSGADCETLAAALEFGAGHADEYEPRTADHSADPLGPLKWRVLRFVLPAGVALAVAYGVAAVLAPRLAGLAINGEAVSVAPLPEAVLVVGTLAVVISRGLQYLLREREIA